MKSFLQFITTLVFCLVVASSCKKEKADPIKERDRRESVNLLKEFLQGPNKFEVSIYATPTKSPSRKLVMKTTNDQIFFEGYYLYVYPHQLGYHIDHFGDLNAINVSGSHTEIETLELHFLDVE